MQHQNFQRLQLHLKVGGNPWSNLKANPHGTGFELHCKADNNSLINRNYITRPRNIFLLGIPPLNKFSNSFKKVWFNALSIGLKETCTDRSMDKFLFCTNGLKIMQKHVNIALPRKMSGGIGPEQFWKKMCISE